MRFLVDECTGPAVAAWLRAEAHEVFSVYEQARGLDDDSVMRKPFDEDGVLITNDRGFGEKVYRQRRPHRGVIFLRLEDETAPSKIRTLTHLLRNYADQLPSRFVVVTEKRVRFARR